LTLQLNLAALPLDALFYAIMHVIHACLQASPREKETACIASGFYFFLIWRDTHRCVDFWIPGTTQAAARRNPILAKSSKKYLWYMCLISQRRRWRRRHSTCHHLSGLRSSQRPRMDSNPACTSPVSGG
jgi:hypothetical protein